MSKKNTFTKRKIAKREIPQCELLRNVNIQKVLGTGRRNFRVHLPFTITMAHINEHIPSHYRELTRSKRADSTSHLCYPVLDPLILHHDSTEHFSCAWEGTFQWPLRNPQQWSKPSGIKEKDYWTFKSYSFPSSNLKYNSSCINLIYSRSSNLIYSSIFSWEH